MAKVTGSLHKLQGTIHEFTFVNSKTYGHHVRAPRGTYRKAKLNKTLTDNSRRTPLLNKFCRPVFYILKELGKEYHESLLWQQMLGRFRKSTGNQPWHLLKQLEKLELNRQYPLLPVFPNSLNAEIMVQKKGLVLKLETKGHPHFPKKATAYRLEASVIY